MELDQLARLLKIAHMNDQGIESRPFLGDKNRGDGAFIQRIGPEPVYGFGREDDQPALAQELAALRDGVSVGRHDARRSLRRV